MNLSSTIIVEKKNGEKLRQWLIKNSLLNRNMKIQSEKNILIFPVIRALGDTEIKNLEKKFQKIRFEQRKMELKNFKEPKDLITALRTFIPENLHKYIPKSFDIIGKLIVIEIPEELEQYEKLMGDKILDLHPSISSVFKKVKPIQGEYRLRNLQIIAGHNNTETIHKENKCIFRLDINKMYFSPRLATEHIRVCSLVKSGELILDMFSGVGPFSILIAKNKQTKVFAVDLNPAAIDYLKRNIILNKVENYVTPFEGDIRDFIKKNIDLKFDRIIMNLPSKSFEFLDLASRVLKERGIIHYYEFVSENNIPLKAQEKLKKFFEKESRKIEILSVRKVRPYAPYIWQIGIDILVE